VKLKQTEVPAIRMQIQVAQGNLCPLCHANFGDAKLQGKKLVPKYTPVLDHNHDNGKLRGVLCNNCNGMEGKIKNRVRRAKRDLSDIQWLRNLLGYWEHHQEARSVYVYPTHKSDDDKRLLRNKRARLKRASHKAAIALKGLK